MIWKISKERKKEGEIDESEGKRYWMKERHPLLMHELHHTYNVGRGKVS